MPTLCVIDGGKITMYAGDHNPPHFHLLGPGYQEKYAIKGLELIKSSGKAPKGTRKAALTWAAEHEAELRAKWAELNEQDKKAE